ncbi:MAG TPA: SAM-dependent methyltransferase [Micromonosporaceae bacterium]|nr:SAM-dependent methyltransferase [Micromonosporaceae bacterium]
MTRPERALEDLDLSRPNPARVYDYYLGGAHNFEVDRELARAAMRHMPQLPEVMQEERGFLHRAVRFVVNDGIEQILDIGCGISMTGNVHEVAHAMNPMVRVACVDRDPVAVANSRQMLAGKGSTTVVQADLREPDAILGNARVRRLIDLDKPLGVVIVGVLHFISDREDLAGILGVLRDAMASGSYLVMTHGSHDGQPAQTRPMQELYRQRDTPIWFRPLRQISDLFRGFSVVDPGIVWLPLWRPDSPCDIGEHPERLSRYAAVFRRD